MRDGEARRGPRRGPRICTLLHLRPRWLERRTREMRDVADNDRETEDRTRPHREAGREVTREMRQDVHHPLWTFVRQTVRLCVVLVGNYEYIV